MTDERPEGQSGEPGSIELMAAGMSGAMPSAKGVGIVAMMLGGLCALYAFTMETTAPYSDTLNLGLLQGQLMVLQLGLAVFIAGAVLTGCGAILEEVRKGKPGG